MFEDTYYRGFPRLMFRLSIRSSESLPLLAIESKMAKKSYSQTGRRFSRSQDPVIVGRHQATSTTRCKKRVDAGGTLLERHQTTRSEKWTEKQKKNNKAPAEGVSK